MNTFRHFTIKTRDLWLFFINIHAKNLNGDTLEVDNVMLNSLKKSLD